VIEIGAILLAIIGWSIDAHRRADERLDAAEGKIGSLLIEVQRLRAHVLARSKAERN
jgi:hypothetical protein